MLKKFLNLIKKLYYITKLYIHRCIYPFVKICPMIYIIIWGKRVNKCQIIRNQQLHQSIVLNAK